MLLLGVANNPPSLRTFFCEKPTVMSLMMRYQAGILVSMVTGIVPVLSLFNGRKDSIDFSLHENWQ